MKSRIFYTKPSITELEIAYATDAASNGWGSQCYAYISRFEELFRTHLGSTYAIATSSATGALHMGMSALGIGPGDEVILADTNWIATVAPIVHLGAMPVFVDVLEESWCLDPAKVERAIGPRTKAIVAVHLYGNLCDMNALLNIGKRHNVQVIEDAAEAIGSVYNGRRAGTLGCFGAFSFHGTKTITTGEGGMFVTDDPALYERVLTLSNHGRAKDQVRQFWPEMVGFKYKMSNIQAAIGCAQVERIDTLVSRKQEILTYYREGLKDVSTVVTNSIPEGVEHGAWMPTIVFNESVGANVDVLRASFEQQNIDARVFFSPLSSLPFFEDRPENIVSRRLEKNAINLPSYHDITAEEQDRVLAVVIRQLEFWCKKL